jgi:hypothetical protein
LLKATCLEAAEIFSINMQNREIGKVTRRDEQVSRALKIAPFLTFFLASVPIPILLFFFSFLVAEDAAVYILMAFSSLAIGVLLGLFGALLFFLYRRRWERGLRERLAADGITAGELKWFWNELKSSEKLSLRQIEQQSPALADAYRETLAARLTATRLIATSKRELLKIERGLNRAKYLQNADTTLLQNELISDKQRIERLLTEAGRREATAVAQLQTIEATAQRVSSLPRAEIALERLEAAQQQAPFALEAARLEQSARDIVRGLVEEQQDEFPRAEDKSRSQPG